MKPYNKEFNYLNTNYCSNNLEEKKHAKNLVKKLKEVIGSDIKVYTKEVIYRKVVV